MRETERLSFRSSLFRESFEGALDSIESLLQLTRAQCGVGRSTREARIVTPPVEADLFGFVDRAHEQSHLNRQQLDIREIDLDIAGDDQPFVEDAVEDVYKAVRA